MLIPDIYKEFFKKNKISLDQAQLSLLHALLNLTKDIEKYKSSSIFAKLIFSQKDNFPQGLYIYGEVGSGKSMLVKLFFENIFITKKIHLHYQGFMQIIHKLLKDYRAHTTKQNYILQVANYFSEKYELIYIDELEIIDIADAMVIGQVFKELFKKKITIIITSNRAPHELYANGLQRDEFMKFVKQVEINLAIYHHNSLIDYRKLKTLMQQSYYFPLTQKSSDSLKNSFTQITNNVKYHQRILSVYNREIICLRTYNNKCWFYYDELFEKPLGSADYKEIIKEFDYIFVANIPIFGSENNNEARRFIIFIDCLYENHKLLICSAADAPEKLCNNQNIEFEFKRTISRLIEMQSEEYFQSFMDIQEKREKKCQNKN